MGIFAEPEQLVFNVTKNDKFIVIASDGVFEFITSCKVSSGTFTFAGPRSDWGFMVE